MLWLLCYLHLSMQAWDLLLEIGRKTHVCTIFVLGPADGVWKKQQVSLLLNYRTGVWKGKQSNLQYFNDVIGGFLLWNKRCTRWMAWFGLVAFPIHSYAWWRAKQWSLCNFFFDFFKTQIGQIHRIECERHRDLSGRNQKSLRKGQKRKNRTLRWDISSGQKTITMAAWQVFEPCFPQTPSSLDHCGSNCRGKTCWMQIHTTIVQKLSHFLPSLGNYTRRAIFPETCKINQSSVDFHCKPL